jgi:CBS domain-containing protein
MVPAAKPLFSMTAADLMSATLVMVPEEMSLKGAAHLLAQGAVSGAPVVNSEGGCVGVLSATDFVHWMDREHGGPAACAASPASKAAPQMVDTAELPDQAVRDYMTPNPVTVFATATIGELARNMIDVHIHRVIVVDKSGKPIGIVSSTDLLAALAHAEQAHRTASAAS